ncbi:hypothetical protein EJ110_NYTH22335 [Nymphaea thermarum]|nr:hypothetical protein EJ110_NYTH22335 [Nymphaea thermarum]
MKLLYSILCFFQLPISVYRQLLARVTSPLVSPPLLAAFMWASSSTSSQESLWSEQQTETV